MTRLLTILALLFGLSSAYAQTQRTNTAHIDPLGYCQLTGVVAATAISTCSGGIPQRTVWAVICVEVAAIRWRDDGTNPTAAVGMPVGVGQCVNYSGTMAAFSAIGNGGGATLNISFYAGAPQT